MDHIVTLGIGNVKLRSERKILMFNNLVFVARRMFRPKFNGMHTLIREDDMQKDKRARLGVLLFESFGYLLNCTLLLGVAIFVVGFVPMEIQQVLKAHIIALVTAVLLMPIIDHLLMEHVRPFSYVDLRWNHEQRLLLARLVIILSLTIWSTASLLPFVISSAQAENVETTVNCMSIGRELQTSKRDIRITILSWIGENGIITYCDPKVQEPVKYTDDDIVWYLIFAEEVCSGPKINYPPFGMVKPHELMIGTGTVSCDIVNANRAPWFGYIDVTGKAWNSVNFPEEGTTYAFASQTGGGFPVFIDGIFQEYVPNLTEATWVDGNTIIIDGTQYEWFSGDPRVPAESGMCNDLMKDQDYKWYTEGDTIQLLDSLGFPVTTVPEETVMTYLDMEAGNGETLDLTGVSLQGVTYFVDSYNTWCSP